MHYFKYAITAWGVIALDVELDTRHTMIELLNQIHHADWLTNNLPDKSVQLIIADPPYFEVKGSFDFVWKSFDDYLKDVEKWAIECKRILADNGTLLWYGDAKNIAYSQIIFDKYFNLINNLVWDKGSFMGLEKSEGLRSFAPCTERILMYSLDNGLQEINNNTENYLEIRNYFNSEREKIGKSLTWINREVLGYNNGKDGMAGNILSVTKKGWSFPTKEQYLKLQKTGCFEKPYEIIQKRYFDYKKEYEERRRPFINHFKLQEILRFSNEAQKTGAKYDHDTCKPEALTRALILTCSRHDDIVFVPFAGSGTEVAMAIKEGRKAIGYDIEKKYVDMANRRVDIINAQPSLFCFA